MQDNRNEKPERPATRADALPRLRSVYAVGESHALCMKVRRDQVPWLAAEIDRLRRKVEEELGHAGRPEDPRAGDAVERRSYQLRVLALIRDQLPVSDEAVAAATASPWEATADDAAREVDGIDGRVAVVGPTDAMLVLTHGAARRAAEALGEALERRARRRDSGITPAVKAQLHSMAAAAAASTESYVEGVIQQSYSFDPGDQDAPRMSRHGHESAGIS